MNVLGGVESQPRGRANPAVVEALYDVRLWDVFMSIQNGELHGVAWSDVESCRALRERYGALSDRVCKQASVVESTRSTLDWSATLDAAASRIGDWEILSSLHTASRSSPALRLVCIALSRPHMLGRATSFVHCDSMDYGTTPPGLSNTIPKDEMPRYRPSSTTLTLHERLSAVGQQYGLTNLTTALPKLFAMDNGKMVELLQDLRKATRNKL